MQIIFLLYIIFSNLIGLLEDAKVKFEQPVEMLPEKLKSKFHQTFMTEIDVKKLATLLESALFSKYSGFFTYFGFLYLKQDKVLL